MALNYLSIPSELLIYIMVMVLLTTSVTSTNVEHVFSQGCLILSHVHNWLSAVNTCSPLSQKLESAGLCEEQGHYCYHNSLDIWCERDERTMTR
jgi:hypothetical protein